MSRLNRTVSVAPMMDCTDKHERFFLRLISKNVLLYTEMIVSEAIDRGDKKKLLEFDTREKPVALQLGGSSPKLLGNAAYLGEEYGYDEINLNCGCPSDRVQKGRFGACLMLEPEHVANCLAEMQNAVEIPVTIKCRLGIDHHESYEFIHNFISTVKKSGIKTFIIHARNGILKGLSPRQNRNIPPLKYDYVYKLKQDFPELDIVINGGIKNLEQSQMHLKYVDGVMIGRSAYDNPFMLKDIEKIIFKEESLVKSKKEILNKYLDYVEIKVSEGHNLPKMLKHLFGLSKGDKNAKNFRLKIIEAMKNNEVTSVRNDLEDLLVY